MSERRVAIIGHVDSGRTSLTAAIIRVLQAQKENEYERQEKLDADHSDRDGRNR